MAKHAQPSSNEALEAAWRMAGPILTKLAGASGVGLVVGIAIKRLLHFVAVCLGFAFIALQLLARAGFVTVHWDRMEKAAVTHLDTNADGRLDEQDLRFYFNGLGLLTAGLPNAGGFIAGLLAGLRI